MTTEQDRREAAIERLEEKRGFKAHLAVYLIVNAGLVLIWAVAGGGYFWPIWAIGGWGIGLALNAWTVYRRPITEDQVLAEMQRGESSASRDMT